VSLPWTTPDLCTWAWGVRRGFAVTNVHELHASFHFGQTGQEKEDQASKNRKPCPSPARFQSSSGLGGERAAFCPFLLSPPPRKKAGSILKTYQRRVLKFVRLWEECIKIFTAQSKPFSPQYRKQDHSGGHAPFPALDY